MKHKDFTLFEYDVKEFSDPNYKNLVLMLYGKIMGKYNVKK